MIYYHYRGSVVVETKCCTICGAVKSVDQFKDGRQCKKCLQTKQQEWRAANREHVAAYERARRRLNVPDPAKTRAEMLKCRYGITTEEFESILASQGHQCAICGTDTPGGRGTWHIDHDHQCCAQRYKTCGKCIRGLLCVRCNAGIGYLQDDVSILRSAIKYLETNAGML